MRLTLVAGTLLMVTAVHWASRAEVSQPMMTSAQPSFGTANLVLSDLVEALHPAIAPPVMPHPSSVIARPLAPAAPPEFAHIMQWAKQRELAERSLPEILQAVSEQFLGATYREHLLDQTDSETIFVSLKEFDCVLFVETVLALARGIAVQDYTYPTFLQNLQAQRYWNGKIDGYCSRLHYFSTWIQDNAKRNTVADMSSRLGGVPFNQPLDFMSRHWQKYPQLLHSPNNRQCIQAMEAKIDPATIRYIPRFQIARLYQKLQPGDIVAMTTDIPGLDATHTGLVYRSANGNIGLIHAAPIVGVKISTDLQTYVDRLGATGILVARPLAVKTLAGIETAMQ
jgi:Protein of unknown function (DUF1460)